MASPILERKTKAKAEKLKKIKCYPAAVVGAESSYTKRINISGPIKPAILTAPLRKKLLILGNLYTEANGNTIGCCAEVNAANQVIIEKPFCKLPEINFSKAIRPRTMQEVAQCKNCKITFS